MTCCVSYGEAGRRADGADLAEHVKGGLNEPDIPLLKDLIEEIDATYPLPPPKPAACLRLRRRSILESARGDG